MVNTRLLALISFIFRGYLFLCVWTAEQVLCYLLRQLSYHDTILSRPGTQSSAKKKTTRGIPWRIFAPKRLTLKAFRSPQLFGEFVDGGTRFESHNSPRAANELCQEYQMRSTSRNWRLIEIHKPRSVNHLVYALIAFEVRQLDWVGSPRAELCCVTSRVYAWNSSFTINTHGRPTSTFKALIKYVLIAQREIDWLRDWSRFRLSDNQANFLRLPKIEAKDAE